MKKLAVLGPKGTYSDIACTKLSSRYSIQYYPNIYTVLEQVDEETDALVPFENTLDGFVMESLDGIMKYDLCIVEQVKLEVNFQFVSNEKKLENIHHTFVQFKTYGQCLDYLQRNHLEPIITQSNIESFNRLTQMKESGYSAIIPAHTESNQFSYVERNIINNLHNETRFVLITKHLSDSFNQDHFNCSITIRPNLDKPGILYSILRVFYDNHINLKAILSRPRKDEIGKYTFYIEIEGTRGENIHLNSIKKTIEELGCTFHLRGIYNSF